MPMNKNGSKLALSCVCQVSELFMKRAAHGGSKTPMGPPTTRDPADFNFSIL